MLIVAAAKVAPVQTLLESHQVPVGSQSSFGMRVSISASAPTKLAMFRFTYPLYQCPFADSEQELDDELLLDELEGELPDELGDELLLELDELDRELLLEELDSELLLEDGLLLGEIDDWLL